MITFRFLKYSLFLLLLIVFFSSCNKNPEHDIIEREEFINILTDLQIAEGIMANKGWYDATMTDSTKSYYNFILKKYNMSRAKFDNSLAYYSNDLEDLISIYDVVLANINSKIPQKLDSSSIYNIIAKSLEEAEMRIDPNKRFGVSGSELWKQKNFFNFPGDSTIDSLNLDKVIENQCLIAFKADFIVTEQNKTKKAKMKITVDYSDSTSNNIEKQLEFKVGEWIGNHLLFKTDSSKIPVRLKSSIFVVDNITDSTMVNIRGISIKQYAPNKDTTYLFYNAKPPKLDKKKLPKNKLSGTKPKL